MKDDICCFGYECPIKNQCMRYTHPMEGKRMGKCTNMKMFIQDKDKVNTDGMRR